MKVQSICFAMLVVLAGFHARAQWVQTAGPGGGTVSCLAVSGTNLFAGTWSGGVFHSTNNGTSWTAVNPGLTNTSVYSLAVLGTILFAGTDGGVFLSTDNGTSWTAVNNGLTDTLVTSLAVSGANLFAGTSTAGVWRRPLVEMVTSVEGPLTGHPTRFSLQQNYPNPFNPSTTIEFELPRASQVSLSVFDVLGRKVSELVNEREDAGVHEVKFDGFNVASGIYFYKIQAGDFTQTKRFLLLK